MTTEFGAKSSPNSMSASSHESLTRTRPAALIESCTDFCERVATGSSSPLDRPFANFSAVVGAWGWGHVSARSAVFYLRPIRCTETSSRDELSRSGARSGKRSRPRARKRLRGRLRLPDRVTPRPKLPSVAVSALGPQFSTRRRALSIIPRWRSVGGWPGP
jgi:hypothetical protein